MKNFDNKKKNRPNNVLEVPLFTGNMDADTEKAILEVLENTRFAQISFPISAYKYQIDSNTDPDDNRTITAGYIRKYDAETKKFTVVIFNKLSEIIMAFKEPTMDVSFTQYKGSFGTITRLVVADAYEEAEEDDSEPSDAAE